MNIAEKDGMNVLHFFLLWLHLLSCFPNVLCLHLKAWALVWEAAIWRNKSET